VSTDNSPAVPIPTYRLVPISSINFDESTVVRANYNKRTILEMAAERKRGVKFPPIDLFGDEHVMADGRYRTFSAQKNGDEFIVAVVHPGGLREAIEFALGSNHTYGVRRSNRDKRRYAEVGIKQHPDWSSRKIAELCGVGDDLVNEVRKQLSETDSCAFRISPTRSFPTRHISARARSLSCENSLSAIATACRLSALVRRSP